MFCLTNEKRSAESRGATTNGKHSNIRTALRGRWERCFEWLLLCSTVVIFIYNFFPPSMHGSGFPLAPCKHKTSIAGVSAEVQPPSDASCPAWFEQMFGLAVQTTVSCLPQRHLVTCWNCDGSQMLRGAELRLTTLSGSYSRIMDIVIMPPCLICLIYTIPNLTHTCWFVLLDLHYMGARTP